MKYQAPDRDKATNEELARELKSITQSGFMRMFAIAREIKDITRRLKERGLTDEQVIEQAEIKAEMYQEIMDGWWD